MNSLKDIMMTIAVHSETKRMTKVGIKIKEIPFLVFFLIECLKKWPGNIKFRPKKLVKWIL